MKPSSARVSLRRRLQTSSLLTVLAGLALVVLAHRELLDRSRAQRHRLAADQVRQELLQLSPASGPAEFQVKLDHVLSPGRLFWLELEPGQPYRWPRRSVVVPQPVTLAELVDTVKRRCVGGDHLVTISVGGRRYLCSSQPLSFSGRPAVMRVVEDITADLERRRIVLLLLLAAAGLASLLTSVLLRLVFRRTLLPLDQLSAQLGRIDAECLEQTRLSSIGQPEELKPIVAAFNALLDRLAGARQRQQAFVDGVAHELRTPITLISGYAQSLQRQGHPLAGGPELELIAREAERMGRLVRELLDIAREEAGRLQLGRDPLDLDEALLTAFERLEPLASARLRLRIPEDGSPPLGLGDSERLQQCLTNLVENALKYTPEGTPIELFSSTSASEAVLHVRDHGQGVTLAEQERIFERFVRGSSEANASGSGIGLAMVRLLMRRMGGEVRVEAAPGGGADFQLVLERVQLSTSAPLA